MNTLGSSTIQEAIDLPAPPRVVRIPTFAAHGHPMYARLATVALKSLRRHHPTWDSRLVSYEVSAPPDGVYRREGLPLDWLCVSKLRVFREALEECPDGTELLILDADTLVLQPLTDLWSLRFDVMVTTRVLDDMEKKHGKPPLNIGVMAFRVSPRVREWLKAWEALALGAYTAQARSVWVSGIDQHAIVPMLTPEAKALFGITTLSLPCREWNCEQNHWSGFNDKVRILHIKEALRGILFRDEEPASGRLRQLADLWRAEEAR